MPGDIFFPEKGGSTRDAMSVCKTCKVRRACFESALAYDERFGIWGGLSERERRDTAPYTHLRAHETRHDLVCRPLLEQMPPNKFLM